MKKSHRQNTVLGAVLGAVLGSVVGGVLGAVLGGVLGAVLGAAISLVKGEGAAPGPPQPVYIPAPFFRPARKGVRGI